MQLKAAVSDFELQLGQVAFGHGGGGIIQQAVPQQQQAVVSEGARHTDFGLNFRQTVSHGLKLGQGLAERLPLLHVASGPLIARLRWGDGQETEAGGSDRSADVPANPTDPTPDSWRPLAGAPEAARSLGS